MLYVELFFFEKCVVYLSFFVVGVDLFYLLVFGLWFELFFVGDYW